MRYYYHCFPWLLLSCHHIMFTLSSLSPRQALGCNSAWSQPGKTAFLCCAGNRKNIMSSAVTFAKICYCAAASLTWRKSWGQGFCNPLPRRTGLYLDRSIALPLKAGTSVVSQTLSFSGLALFGVQNCQSAKTARKLQVLNLSPPPGLLFSQPQGCNCSICMLGRQSSVYPTVRVFMFEL